MKEALDKYNTLAKKSNAQLVAVSKTKPIALIEQAYSYGHRIFGENKVQELVDKHEKLPKDIEWHMIGHLQSNKVKYIAPFVSLIHAVDSFKLLKEINKQGVKHERVIPVLLQVKIASEESKFGLDTKDVAQILDQLKTNPMNNVRIDGLMGMATNTEDTTQIKQEFSKISALKQELSDTYSSGNLNLQELSIGMSSDYNIALENGSTMIRIGSAIFGKRDQAHV